MSVPTFEPEQVADARRKGFTDQQMLLNCDLHAAGLGDDLKNYVTNVNRSWDGELAKIVAKAEAARAYRRELLGYLLRNSSQ